MVLQLSASESRVVSALDHEIFLNATKEAVNQALELIALTETVYNLAPGMVSSPIGKHIRHIIDHFWAYQEGVVNGEIDYSLRHRDAEIEREPAMAKLALNGFLDWIESHPPVNKDLLVKTEIAISEKTSACVISNQYRELAFLIGHTYHHLAYASLLAKTLNIDTPEHIGIAPATATYLRETSVNKP